MRIAIIAITRNGAALGAQISEGFPRADLYVLQKYATAAGKKALPFIGELKELVRKLWQSTDGFVFIMATGIVVRMIAPLLESKDKDPAVVVMDDAGRFAVPILSGHLGGANELARNCALLTGGQEIITTATDVNDLPSFDVLAQREGWIIDDLSRVKVLNSMLLDDSEIAVVDGTGRIRICFHGRCSLSFHDTFIEALQSSADGYLFVTNRQLPPQIQSERVLILRPQNLVLGIGCNSGTRPEEIEDLVCTSMKRLFLSMKSLKCVASATAKSLEPGLLEFAARRGLPLSFYDRDELNGIAVPSPPSKYAITAIGAAGVAEPAALLASGGGTMLLKKVKSDNVTLSIAECR